MTASKTSENNRPGRSLRGRAAGTRRAGGGCSRSSGPPAVSGISFPAFPESLASGAGAAKVRTAGLPGSCRHSWPQVPHRTVRPADPRAAGSTRNRVEQFGQLSIIAGVSVRRSCSFRLIGPFDRPV